MFEYIRGCWQANEESRRVMKEWLQQQGWQRKETCWSKQIHNIEVCIDVSEELDDMVIQLEYWPTEEQSQSFSVSVINPVLCEIRQMLEPIELGEGGDWLISLHRVATLSVDSEENWTNYLTREDSSIVIRIIAHPMATFRVSYEAQSRTYAEQIRDMSYLITRISEEHKI